MASRWKRERCETLILMHAHNRWSRWNAAILIAAEDMGLPVSSVDYPNCSGDGSWDHDIYTSAPVLERLGGLDELRRRADIHHAEMMGVGQ